MIGIIIMEPITSTNMNYRAARDGDLDKLTRFILSEVDHLTELNVWEYEPATNEVRVLAANGVAGSVVDESEMSLSDALGYVHPDDRESLRAAIERAVDDGEPFDQYIRVVSPTSPAGPRGSIASGRIRGVYDENAALLRGSFRELTRQRTPGPADEPGPTSDDVRYAVPEDAQRHREPSATSAVEGERFEHQASVEDASPSGETASSVGDAAPAESEGTQATPPQHRTGDTTDPASSDGGGSDWESKRTSDILQRDVFAEGPVMIFKWKNERGWPVAFASPNVESITGYTPEELCSGDVPYADLIHDHDRIRVAQEVERNSTEGTDRIDHEPYRIVTNDGRIRWVLDYTKILRQDGEITHYLGYLVDITERRDQTTQLEQAETVGNLGTWRWNLETDEVTWSDGMYELFDRDPAGEPPTGEEFVHLVHPEDRRAFHEAFLGSSADEHDLEYRIRTGDETKWVRGRATVRLDEEGEPLEVVAVCHEITRRKTYEEALEAIRRAGRELTRTDSTDEIASLAVETAEEVFDSVSVRLFRYDDEVSELVPAAESDAAIDCYGESGDSSESRKSRESSAIPPGESVVWQAYVDGDRIECESCPPDGSAGAGPVDGQRLIVSLGDHGVLVLDRPEGSFDSRSHSLADVLAVTVESAFDRAETARAIQDYDETLTAQAERLRARDELLSNACSLYMAVTGQQSRTDRCRAVCQQLLAVDGIDAAWIAEPGRNPDTISTITEFGMPAPYLEDRTGGDGSPMARVLGANATVEHQHIASDIHDQPWKSGALAHGFESALGIPIEHGDIFYGGVVVYSSDPAPFTDRLRSILEDLGRLLGHAFHSTELGDALQAKGDVDFSFAIDPARVKPFRSVAEALGSEVRIRQLTRREANTVLIHCVIKGHEPSTVRQVVGDVAGVRNISVVSESPAPTYEVVAVDFDSLGRTLELPAAVRALHVTETDCELVLTTSRDENNNELVATVQDQFPSATLTGRDQADPVAAAPWSYALNHELTEKQAQILETAYRSGYFDEDRKQTGSEIAESLDISQPTFSNQLRAAQYRLFSAIWE